MIDTVIFDYGNTLVRFNERELAASYTDDPDAALQLVSVLFSRTYWDRLDAGTLSREDWLSDAAAHLPKELHPLSKTIADTWFYRLPVIDGMEEIVHTLKKSGKKLYLLSNIAKDFSEHADEIALLKEFDGLICSADHKVTKPSPEIYEILINTYRLSTDSCLFVDDREDNLKAARQFGIKTYHFDGNAAAFAAFLADIV